MSKFNDWSIGFKQIISIRACHVCNGDGKVEAQIAADDFREDTCDMCNGSGELELDDEDE